MTNDSFNGRLEAAHEPGVVLELSVEEARALDGWLLKLSSDGSTPLDDETLAPALLRLRGALDYVDGVAKIRQQLEQAGLPSERLTDEQVADLGRKIADAPVRR